MWTGRPLRAFRAAMTVVALALLAQSSSAQDTQSDKCPPNVTVVSCFTTILKKSGVRDSAKRGREQWQKVWFLLSDLSPGPWVALPDGSVYNPGLRERKYAVSNRMDSQTSVAIAEWNLFTDVLYQHHLEGTLTFWNFPCNWDCSGHSAGFEWAESQRIRGYQDCREGEQSFREGCWAYVAKRQNHAFPKM